MKQQSTVLKLLCNVLHCIDRFALHLTILLSNKPRSSSRTGSHVIDFNRIEELQISGKDRMETISSRILEDNIEAFKELAK